MIFFNPETNYCWHPLGKYVDEVKFRVGIICTLKSKPFPRLFKDFLKILEDDLVQETPQFSDSAELLEIFKPLIINQWNQLVLFKYGNYIDLNEKGYGTDFFELHDGLYLHCRSIVFDIGVNIWGTPQVALASMDKFKNYNEDNNEWSERVINANFMLANKIEVTDKMDGSYQQYTYYKGQIIGSGSQAINPDASW